MSSHWLADSVCPGKCGIASAPLVVVQKCCRLSEQQEIITEALTTAVILSLHSPFLPRPFHPNWLPVRTASCQQVWKLIAELFLLCVCAENGRRMRCLPGRVEERGPRKCLSGLLAVCFLSASSPLPLTLFFSFSHVCQGGGWNASPWRMVG